MALFLLLGAIGIPVFHNFTGGLGILLGPTGGYLIGYIILAFFAGCHRDLKVPFLLSAFLGETLLYIIGTAWFIFQSGTSFAIAIASCVLPFFPGDVLKIFLVYAIKKHLSPVYR